jgi:FAD/FMN-containing dehydrogenase
MSSWIPPACFLQLNTTSDVAVALKIVTYTQSKFAIRSGGHNPNSGFAGVNESGIVIDLSNLNSISLSPDLSSVSVGPGAHWGDVYAYLDPYNVSAVGGRNPPVGVGGLLLGGK